MKMKQNLKLFILVYFFALFIRLAVVFLTGFQIVDSGYLEYAQNLKNHGTFFEVVNNHGVGQAWNGTYYADASPAYPFFISLFSNNLFLVSVWQSLVYSCLPLVAFLLSATLFNNKKVTLISALACCVYPFFVYSSNQLIDTGLACLTFGLIILFNLIYAKKNNFKNLFAVGVVNAIGLLTRQNFLFVIMVFPFFCLFLFRVGTLTLVLRKYLLLFLVTLLFISPWLVRNYLIFKKPIITSNYAGFALWQGNNELTHKYFSMGIVSHIDDYIYLEKMEKKDLTTYENSNEIEKGEFLTRKAVEFIKKNPGLFLENAYLKFISMWSFVKERSPLDRNPFDSPEADRRKNTVYFLTTFPLFLFGALGFLKLCEQEKRMALFFLIIFLAYNVPFLVFIGQIRTRVPFDTLLIILSSFLAVRVFNFFASLGREKHG